MFVATDKLPSETELETFDSVRWGELSILRPKFKQQTAENQKQA